MRVEVPHYEEVHVGRVVVRVVKPPQVCCSCFALSRQKKHTPSTKKIKSRRSSPPTAAGRPPYYLGTGQS